jgi:hypothetical protein
MFTINDLEAQVGKKGKEGEGEGEGAFELSAALLSSGLGIAVGPSSSCISVSSGR